MASARTRDRIRKLLALATSPNENEAARAREQADQLMAKHGLSLSDFEEDVIEIVDNVRDALRQRLAIAVTVSRRVTLLCNKNQIAFRGRPRLVESGRTLYQSLIADAAAHCEIGPRDPGRDVWRLCCWQGFVDAVVERLIDDETIKEAPKPNKKRAIEKQEQQQPVADVEPAAVQIERATGDFAQFFAPQFVTQAVTSIRRDAYKAGHMLGMSTAIAPRESVSERLALDQKEHA